VLAHHAKQRLIERSLKGRAVTTTGMNTRPQTGKLTTGFSTINNSNNIHSD